MLPLPLKYKLGKNPYISSCLFFIIVATFALYVKYRYKKISARFCKHFKGLGYFADLLIFYIKKYRSTKGLTQTSLLVIIIINRLFAVFLETLKKQFLRRKKLVLTKRFAILVCFCFNLCYPHILRHFFT